MLHVKPWLCYAMRRMIKCIIPSTEHFLSRVREGVDAVVVPARGHDCVGCLPDQVKTTRALNEELNQTMKDIRQFGDQGAESSQRITELESLCKKHEEAIKKLKQENTTLELMVQSHDELILEIAGKTRLDRMGEDDAEDKNEDEDDDNNDGGGRATATPPLHHDLEGP
jgi:hypothetical protein